MSGKCWVCQRQARGFGHSDGRFKIADPRRYPLDWVFCSRRCQDIFHTLYGRRLTAEERGEEIMVDASEIEIAAMRDCLKAFAIAPQIVEYKAKCVLQRRHVVAGVAGGLALQGNGSADHGFGGLGIAQFEQGFGA